MWVPANLYMFLAIGVLFFAWAKESEREDRGERGTAVSGER
jgi:hypothetical protein